MNRCCPFCGKWTLRLIEEFKPSKYEQKTSWTCDCQDFVLYIHEFKEVADELVS